VVALHGGGGSAKGWPTYTDFGFEKLADRAPFILVYPEGLEGQWNDKRGVSRFYAHKNDIDDVGFLAALIEHLVKTHPIDKNRVFVTGASNGGMMAHYLAATHPDKIAAIATVISAIPTNLQGKLHPSKPLSVLMINGTEDPLVRWEGGVVRLGKTEHGSVISTEDTVAFWVKHNRCRLAPEVEELPDRDRRDGTTVTRYVYSGGQKGTEVLLYKVVGGGHSWPAHEDKRRLLPRAIVDNVVGKKSRDIDACEVIWDFFKHHPRGKD
jgi:polyhydroxybutyrate depolymerase